MGCRMGEGGEEVPGTRVTDESEVTFVGDDEGLGVRVS